MAEEAYAAYNYYFGYYAKTPKHLIAFARQYGIKVTWPQCKNIIKESPDVADYVPKESSAYSKKSPNGSKKSAPAKKNQNKSNNKTQSTPNPVVAQTNIQRNSASRWQHLVGQLTAMGWDYNLSLNALKAHNGNMQLALESLMNGQKSTANNYKKSFEPASPPQNNNVHTNYNPLQKDNVVQNDVQQEEINSNNTNDQININLEEELTSALELLSGGHGSISQRLAAMDLLYKNINDVDIKHYKLLLHSFSEQIPNEDYIYYEYKVRLKAISNISDIWEILLKKLNDKDTDDLINESLEEIFNHLFKILDSNKFSKHHQLVKQCISKIVNSIINKSNNNNSLLLVKLSEILNDKINSENIFQPMPRLFAFEQLTKIVFGIDINSQIINTILDEGDNVKYSSGLNINKQNDLPSNMYWLNCINASKWSNDNDELFKDLFMDSVSLLILDPNRKNQIIANNIAVFMSILNGDFKTSLEKESKHRFEKYYVPQDTVNKVSAEPSPPAQQQPQQNGQEQQNQQSGQYQQNKVSDTFQKHYASFKDYQTEGGHQKNYRIQQQTGVSVAAPSLPDI